MAKLAHYEALVSKLMVCNSSCGSEGGERGWGVCGMVSLGGWTAVDGWTVRCVILIDGRNIIVGRIRIHRNFSWLCI